MPSSHLILGRPLLLLLPIPPSIRVFSYESTLRMRWPKYWSFSFSIISSKEHWGLISFRMDWLDPLAFEGTLKRLLQHHSSKASILRRSAFFIVQFSHPYVTTGKTIALTRWTFVGKVMSLLLNMLSRLVTLLLNKVWEDKHHHNKFPLSIIYSLVFLVPKCLRGSSDDVLADSAVHRSPSQVLLGISHHCASSSYLHTKSDFFLLSFNPQPPAPLLLFPTYPNFFKFKKFQVTQTSTDPHKLSGLKDTLSE